MAYLDTKSLSKAKEKAAKLGCTHFFHHVLKSNEIISTYFVKGNKPDSDGNLQEIAHYIASMQSFNRCERKQPVINLNDVRTGYTALHKLDIPVSNSDQISQPVSVLDICK